MWLFISFLCVFLSLHHAEAACTSLNAPALCSSVLNYQINDAICSATGRETAVSLGVLGSLGASCRDAFVQYQCGHAWPKCDDGSSKPPTSVCTALTSSCVSADEQKWLASLGTLDCDAASTQTYASGAYANSVSVDRCETYDASLTFCAGVVDWPVFVPAGRTQAQMDEVGVVLACMCLC